jgi:RNA polymerase sigma-70 factor (ECF subfamily)
MSAEHAALIVEHAAFVWRVLIHLGVPRSRLEDASQEVFMVALRDSFAGRSAFTSFLYGVCRNVARSERRRYRDDSEVPMAELPEAVVQPAQEGELWVKRAHERLLRALAQLDEAQREVFVLFEIAELSMEEVACATASPLSTCYSRLYAARVQLQSELRRRALSPTPAKEAKS